MYAYKDGYLAIVPIALLVALGGCSHEPPGSSGIQSLKPVCTALIGPIRYNSADPNSQRHAGPDLAPDLEKRNRVGSRLNCPEYKHPPK